VRGALLAVGIAVALGATAGLAYLAMQSREEDDRDIAQTPVEVQPDADPPDAPPAELRIRPYESSTTLIEDLRDALAGDPKALNAECWRVSGRMKAIAASMLEHIARNESSPQVRALVVLAAGVHVQDEPALFRRMEDRDARVRRAAVLAVGYQEKGKMQKLLGVAVPIGRPLDERTRARLEERAQRETDESVRDAIERVLG
jgi:hypothetical protein